MDFQNNEVLQSHKVLDLPFYTPDNEELLTDLNFRGVHSTMDVQNPSTEERHSLVTYS